MPRTDAGLALLDAVALPWTIDMVGYEPMVAAWRPRVDAIEAEATALALAAFRAAVEGIRRQARTGDPYLICVEAFDEVMTAIDNLETPQPATPPDEPETWPAVGFRRP